MRVLISGASGLVGSRLARSLVARGDQVQRLVRRAPEGTDELEWNPADITGGLDPLALDTDAVVHLAAENIAEGRWNAAKRARIRDSRVIGTRTLSEALARATAPPRVLVSASAVGYYGERGDALLDETSARGAGFLPQICADWEAATRPAEETGIRVVKLRLGVVLDRERGALAKMRLPFKLGLGGRVGSGRQFMSWIAIADLVRAIAFALDTEQLTGPVNAVAPEPVTNAAFTAALGGALSRPTLLPMPAFAARLAFGPMADDLLLASTRAVPGVLRDAGFTFDTPGIDGALRATLDHGPRP